MSGHIRYDEWRLKYLREGPENLAAYLKEMFSEHDDGDDETRLRVNALLNVAEAWGLVDDLRAKLSGATLPPCKSDPPTPASPARKRPEPTKS